MDGLLVLDKHSGITSAKALYAVRKILGQKKSGHAGSLDPMATGVLLICLGRSTKLVEQLMGLQKTYVASARLDVTSSSFDADREMTPIPVAAPPSDEQIRFAVAAQKGRILQVPPAVSAIKIGGRAAYKLERAGKPPELAARPVDIYAIEVLRYAWPELDFAMSCGRGTYVRAVIRDIGLSLGTGGCLTSLRRTSIGPFDAAQARTVESLRTSESASGAVIAHTLAIEQIRAFMDGEKKNDRLAP
ncbi:MAG: tRNA pseudouridine(55) synthase TruB [Planctomycetes bacterium]|nr:tRNA pseudouridine(55) synthase TruB [Planctomycetota bacterium]